MFTQPVWLRLSRLKKLHFHMSHISKQGQDEEGVLRSGLGLGSGGALQERRADPQLQGDPENQRQKEK